MRRPFYLYGKSRAKDETWVVALQHCVAAALLEVALGFYVLQEPSYTTRLEQTAKYDADVAEGLWMQHRARVLW